MGWMDYYKLLQKYKGDLSKATKPEMMQAALATTLANPNTPDRARQLAEEKYQKMHPVVTLRYEELKQLLQDEHVDTIDFEDESKPIHRKQHIVSGSAHTLALKIVEKFGQG